ncbi:MULTISPECIES: hypothetical protein [Niastella]|uniref:Uncharacterized protein n=1 Tax=Niastella soli TaxID=2821487 RepID=A0ABS3YZZ1_9BACT|nr:hypothetical protein [Niastella soli]MBO9203082.1 hypothetical protein [Niastella soli]
MRTSLHNIQQIEDYLLKYAGEADQCLFEARLLLQPALHEQLLWQQKTYAIIRQYSRRQLKAEIESVHQHLFNEIEHITFRRKIMALFGQ